MVAMLSLTPSNRGPSQHRGLNCRVPHHNRKEKATACASKLVRNIHQSSYGILVFGSADVVVHGHRATGPTLPGPEISVRCTTPNHNI